MLVAFLLLTSLPWAVVQGALVRGVFTALGIGHEAPHSTPVKRLVEVKWNQAMRPMPVSGPAHAEHGGGGHRAMADPATIVGTDAIAAKTQAAGIAGGYRPHLPSGVYTGLALSKQPEGQRTLQFDRWSGRLLWTNGRDRHGVGAKAVELGYRATLAAISACPTNC